MHHVIVVSAMSLWLMWPPVVVGHCLELEPGEVEEEEEPAQSGTGSDTTTEAKSESLPASFYPVLQGQCPLRI